MHTRLAIVTGASRGLGRAWSAALLADGWEVIGDARDAATLARTAADLGDGFTPVAGDVTDPDHRLALADEVARRGGGLDLLVHNAGTLGPSPRPGLLEVAADRLADVMTTNVVAPVALTSLLLPALERAGGSVVVVTSDAASADWPGWGVYGMSKAALEHAAGTLAAEHPGLRVLALDPGDVRTDMHRAAFPGEDLSDRSDPATVGPAIVALLRSDTPSGSRVAASALLADTGGPS